MRLVTEPEVSEREQRRGGIPGAEQPCGGAKDAAAETSDIAIAVPTAMTSRAAVARARSGRAATISTATPALPSIPRTSPIENARPGERTEGWWRCAGWAACE